VFFAAFALAIARLSSQELSTKNQQENQITAVSVTGLKRTKPRIAEGPLQMYFSGLAIPGVGLGGAYNVDKNTWQFAFNVGMLF
jgi:hypothetical protein